MKIKFKVFYDFDFESQNYKATIYLYLPCDDSKDGRDLLRYFRNMKVAIWEELLHEHFGDWSMGCRYKSKTLVNESIETLKEKVSEMINDITTLLKEVYYTNLNKIRALPEPEYIEVEI